jgi:epoxyqueuosine reductase
MSDPAALKAAIRAEAARLGFDAVGFAAPELGDAGARLDEFLASGRHGEMGWMAEKAARRRDPKALWPEVRTVIALGVNYGPAADPLEALARRDRGTVSVYAQGRDYHDVMKPRLKQLAGWLQRESGAAVKVFVDTAPVMEKPLAARAGLGWQGKHTNLVSRGFGSWLLLGEVFTDLALPPDAAEADHCGSCGACLAICPTAAFPAPYQLDARRCLSYLTIEHKGPIPAEFREPLGNRIYGCDDCLAVCPWNKFAARSREAAFLPRIELTAPRLADLAGLDDPGFRQVFAGSPVKRIGRDRFLRNVLIALGNSGDPAAALPAVEARLADGAALVRGAAVWALSRLASPQRLAALRARHAPAETDADVAEEWRVTFARGPGEEGVGGAMIPGSDATPEETS